MSARPRDSLRGSNATPAADAREVVPARGRARTTEQKHVGSSFRIGDASTQSVPADTSASASAPKPRAAHIPRDNLGPLGEIHQPTQQKTRSQYTPRDHLGPSAASSPTTAPTSGKAHTTSTRNHVDHITAALNHGDVMTPVKREKKVVKETIAPNKAVPNVENQENQTPRDSARKRYHHSTISLASNYEKPLPLPDTSHRVLKNVSSLASDNGQLVTAAPVRAAGKARAPQASGENLNLFTTDKTNPHSVNKSYAGRTNSSSIFASDTPAEPLRPSKQVININNQQTSTEQTHRPARGGVRAINSGASSSNIISWQ